MYQLDTFRRCVHVEKWKVRCKMSVFKQKMNIDELNKVSKKLTFMTEKMFIKVKLIIKMKIAPFMFIMAF